MKPTPITPELIAEQEARILAAKGAILCANDWFGELVLRLDYQHREQCPTFATDGYHCFWNAGFCATLSDKALPYVILHEILHCLDPKTQVMTAKGLRQISAIQEGDYVLDGQGGWTRVNRVASRNHTGEILTVRPAFGDPYRITAEHRVLATLKDRPSSRNARFIPAGELDPDKHMLVFAFPVIQGKQTPKKLGTSRRHYTQHKVFMDAELAELVGWFVADGNLGRPVGKGCWFGPRNSKRFVVWTLGLKKDFQRVAMLIESKLRRKPYTSKLKHADAVRLTVSAKMFARFLADNFYDGRDKTIPKWMLSQPLEVVAGFVRGYAAGDGHRRGQFVRATTVSPGIAGMLPCLLMRLGWLPTLHSYTPTPGRGYANARPGWRINWKESNDLYRGRGDASSETRWFVPIRKIERSAYDGPVYNISTQSQTYALPFSVVHNCVLLHPYQMSLQPTLNHDLANIAMDIALANILDPWMADDKRHKGTGLKLELERPPGGVAAVKKWADLTWIEIYHKLHGQVTEKYGEGWDKVLAAGDGDTESGGRSAAHNAERWKGAVEAANEKAKGQGSVPGDFERAYARALREADPFENHLRRFLVERCKNDLNWARPNQHYLHQRVYLPSVDGQALGMIGMVADTSGSIDDALLGRFMAVAQELLDTHSPSKLVWVSADAEVQTVDEYYPGDTVASAKGGGGTDFRPALNYFERRDEPVLCVIYLTDMQGTFPDDEPGYPVIWLSTTKDAEGPFGTTIFAE